MHIMNTTPITKNSLGIDMTPLSVVFVGLDCSDSGICTLNSICDSQLDSLCVLVFLLERIGGDRLTPSHAPF